MRFNEKPQVQIKAGDRNAALKLFEEALQIARTVQDEDPDRAKSQKIIALSNIAEAQHEAGYLTGFQNTFDEAQKTAATISDAWTRALALHVVISQTQIKTSEITGAKKSLVAAKEAALLSEEESPLLGLHTLSQIAKMEVGMGDTDTARQTISQIHDFASAALAPVKKIQALRIVVEAQASMGDLAEAKQTIVEVQRAAAATAQTKDERPAITIGRIDGNHTVPAVIRDLMEIAELQVSVGDIAAAKQTVDALVHPRDRSDAFRNIITAQAGRGDILDAKRTLEAITDDYDKSSALCQIAEAQAKRGDVEGAKQTVDSITKPDDKCATLRAIAAVQKEMGDLSKASQTYVEARNAVIAITSDLDLTKSMILREIGESQLELGDKGGASQTLLVAQQIAADLPITDVFNERYKPSALNSIAVAQIKAGNAEAAMQAVDALTNNQAKSEMLHVIAIAQAEIGDIVAARQTVNLCNDRHKTESLIAVAGAQSKAQDLMGARQTASEAYQVALRSDDSSYYILRDIGEAQVTAKDLLGALQTAEGIPEYIGKHLLLRQISAAQGEAGDFNGARETIDKIGDAKIKAEALAQLAAAVWKVATDKIL